MTECKSCKAKIFFMKTETGGTMPVDAREVTYNPDPTGPTTFLGPGGVVERGRLSVTGNTKGFIPHWATCPFADQFRRKK